MILKKCCLMKNHILKCEDLELYANYLNGIKKNKINNIIDSLLQVLDDEKPTIVRLCLSSLNNLLLYKIDLSEKQLKVVFDDGKNVWYQFQELDQLELAYAITIHKSQGSEFDVVIIAVPQTAPMLLTRNLLYTAITRAKKLLIILGGKNTIDFMIQNVDSKKRNTGLKIKVEHLLNGDN